jgi:hypothetical protein
VERFLHGSLGARVGSFDTDAFGVLLRMKSAVFQILNNSFLLSSQPQAGVSKHPARLLMPACKGLSKWERHLHGCGDCRQRSFETLCYAKLLRMKLLVLQ